MNNEKDERTRGREVLWFVQSITKVFSNLHVNIYPRENKTTEDYTQNHDHKSQAAFTFANF